MTKKEFVREYAKKLNVSQKEAERALNLFLQTVEYGLKESGQVSFVGWGSYKVVTREEREGRNPQTGQPIRIPAKKVVKFKAGSLLEKEIEGSKKKTKTTRGK